MVLKKIIFTVLHCTAAMIILVLGMLISQLLVLLFESLTGLSHSPISMVLMCVLNIAADFGLVYFYITKIAKKRLSDFLVKSSKHFFIWLAVAVTLPSAVSILTVVFCNGSFYSNAMPDDKQIETVLYAVLMTGICAGLTEELIFRGIIMKYFEKQWGKISSIIIPSLLFGMVHLTNISEFNILDAVQVILAGALVGVMFSLIAQKSNSIFPSALVHGLWNAVMIGDIFFIGDYHNENAIKGFLLTDTPKLLTGGSFGIEASLISILGYTIVIAGIIISESKAKNKKVA
jgi:membrane protease YdiL (CAAX protease family)